MGWLKDQFLRVIEWKDQGADEIVWKYPLEGKAEIMRNSRLVVNPGQKAIFVQEGQIADVFGPGTYKLDDIKNFPILTSLNSWKFLWESPYKGNVYFISTKQFINQNWGTSNPVIMRDQDFGMVRVRGFGTYSFAVSTPSEAMEQLIGASGKFKVRDVNEYFKKMITGALSNVIAESNIPALDLSMHYEELQNAARIKLADNFASIGISLKELIIENLSLPEEVEKMMDKRTNVGVMGGAMQGYAQMESIGAMRDIAKNPGNGGAGIAGLGMNLAAGISAARMYTNEVKEATSADADMKFCPECGAKVKKNAKFCPECGKKLMGDTKPKCPKCGAFVEAGAKFCPECGEKLN